VDTSGLNQTATAASVWTPDFGTQPQRDSNTDGLIFSGSAKISNYYDIKINDIRFITPSEVTQKLDSKQTVQKNLRVLTDCIVFSFVARHLVRNYNLF